ncbi:MAG: tRNA 2-selenouridine(34) synthase MnmH [Clostridia bacterium]|nr:tRNA 2-selenouridine(34) synthase MnmH [Clostridia bacterium]
MYKAIPYDYKDRNRLYIDVRSESEFEKGHIIGAINLPILNDIERHEVGWIYKNASVEEAKKVGLQHGSAKLQIFFETVEKLRTEHPDKKIVFYCARGGYRSRSIALLMRSIDLPVYWLQGGYKSYRQEVLNALQDSEKLPTFIVVNGLSGVGKTHILMELKKLGHPVLDLEGAANHKGSHLGAIGTSGKQSVQSFENEIFDQLVKVDRFYCFVESESKRIGHVFVPNAIFDKLQGGIYIKVSASLDFRISGLIEDYVSAPDFQHSFEAALGKIKPYITKELFAELKEHFKADDYETLTQKLLLNHYDPIYYKSIDSHQHKAEFLVTNYETCANEIGEWINREVLSQSIQPVHLHIDSAHSDQSPQS